MPTLNAIEPQDGERPEGTECRAELDVSQRTRCEVWTRVMGYHRPVSAWNAGKRSEHQERLYFREGRERG